MNQSTTPICPKCHSPIPAGAPLGLCPKCVLKGVATSAEAVKPSSQSASQPTVAEIAPHFPELEVLEVIGVGGMGVVFKARQPKLDRLVALKILSRELAGDPTFTERFDREARVLARLNHPNIVTVFDCGMAGPFAYLMMEFVDGVNLRQAMQTGRVKPAEALALVQDVCGALKFAHERDILHRDIKPENILIDSRGQVKIADFGIAKLVGENERGNLTLTQQGAVLGSPRYMAPEQFDSPGDVDQRADIYSLGVVLYELLTGELPMGRFAPPSQKSAVDVRIDEIVMRTLERERELRFQTIGEVKERVEAATEAKAGAGEKQPDPSPGHTVVIPTGTTARFATAAAICTALSLIPAFLVSIILWHSQQIDGNRLLYLMPFLLPLVILAGLGIGLATRSLRQIRDSGGRLSGTKRAKFGALMWPWVLTTLMTLLALGIWNDEPMGRGWRVGISLTVAVSGLLGIVLIRRVSRWMEGTRPVKVFGPVCWFAVATLWFGHCLSIYYQDRMLAVADYRSEHGATMTVTVRVNPGTTVQFRLIRVDKAGKETPLELQSYIKAPSDQELHTQLKIELKERWIKSDRQKLTVSLQGPHGQNYLRSIYLDDIWVVSGVREGQDSIFRDDEKQRWEFATRHELLFGIKRETLYLEMVSIKNQP